MQYEIEKLNILIDYARVMNNTWLKNNLEEIVKQLNLKK